MDIRRTIGHSIGAIVWTLVISLIFAAIVHFILGDNIWAVLVFYILIAAFPRILTRIADSKSSAIIGSIFTILIVYLVITFIFPIIFGPYIGFPYSILDLGPVVTGLIVSVLVNLLSVYLSA